MKTATLNESVSYRRINPTWRLIFVAVCALVAFVCIWQLVIDDSLTRSWTTAVTVALAIWAVAYLISTYKYLGSIYLFSSAYLLSLLVFHLGQVIFHGLGLDYLPHLETGTTAASLEKASWLTLLATTCFGFGMAMSLKRVQAKPGAGEADKAALRKNFARAYWIGLGLLAAALFGLVLTWITVGNLFAHTRTEVFGGIGDTRGFGLFMLAGPSAAVLMVISANKRLEKLLAYVVAIGIGVVLMLMGYRSSVLFSGLIGAVVWVKVGRRLPLLVALVAVIVVSVSIPTIRILRQLGSFDSITAERIGVAYEASNSRDVIREIGGTNGILADIMRMVPDTEPYWRGRSYYWALSVFWPNFGATAGSMEDPDAIGSLENQLRKGSPSRWYIYKTNRWKFDHGLGAGFSTIAEPYLNFGYPGVVVYFVGLGFLLGRLDQIDLKTHPKTMIFSGALLWPLVKTVRNSFGVFIKPLGLMLVVIVVWRAFTFWKQNRA